MKTLMILFIMILFSSCGNNDCKPMAIPDCICTAEYDPVCGCDNVTYSNACVAECNSITDYKEGECD